MEYMKQLFATLLTLALGSFIFVGILEDYKSDDSIKVKQLEDYFKPARTLANSCLKQQNQLYLHYPQNGSSLRLLFDAMSNLMENPQLERNPNYELVLKDYYITYSRLRKLNLNYLKPLKSVVRKFI